VVAEREGAGATTGSAPGAASVGRRQPGNRCRAGVAQSELKKNKTKPLRSDFFSCHAAVMEEMWRYRGQEIGSEQIVFLREFIAAHPTSSRWKLSRQLCEALGWKQANGACATWFVAACC